MSFIGKYIVSKVVHRVIGNAATQYVGPVVENSFLAEDPYYEEIPIEQLNGRKKGSKRKRQIPLGVSENDGNILRKVRTMAYGLDQWVNFCGMRFGWAAIIGIVPVIGPMIVCYLQLRIVKKANDIEGGLPSIVACKMVANILFDFAIGMIPFVGDFANAIYKASSRNALLLDRHLTAKVSHPVVVSPHTSEVPLVDVKEVEGVREVAL